MEDWPYNCLTRTIERTYSYSIIPAICPYSPSERSKDLFTVVPKSVFLPSQHMVGFQS